MDFWTLSLVTSIIVLFLYYYHQKKRRAFETWGVPNPKELPFLGYVGSSMFRRVHISDLGKELYSLDKEAKYIGIHSFMTPLVIVRDEELIKAVLVKDFEYFSNHDVNMDSSTDPLLTKNLAAINGDEWREMRHLLSPAFTSSKLKSMFELMIKCSESFTDSFIDQCANEEATNIKDAFLKYTNDVIATCAFGIEIDSMKDPTNEFYVYGKEATNTDGYTQLKQIVKIMFMQSFPKLARLLGMKVIPEYISNFFVNIIATAIRTRDEKGINRPDMLQLLMDAREKDSNNFDAIEVTAQAFVFFLAGFETTANQMSLMAHELAVNPEVQEKLYAEISDVLEENNGKITYEAVNNSSYMNAVFHETMRKHPQVALLSRNCSKPYELPPALPNSKPYPVKVGDLIMIPVTAIHENPNYFENPGKFDPERFLDKKSTASDVTNLGFGLGPRMCIGNRFAILETKVLFFHLLKKCKFEPCSKTCIPLVYSKNKMNPIPDEGFWLKISKR